MTKTMQVLQAARALVAAALPGATVVGFTEDAEKPTRIGPQGCAIGQPGDPGTPDVDLSPIAYNYSHVIPLELVGPNGRGGPDLDTMLAALADAVAADPTLGGECDYFSIEAPVFGDRNTDSIASVNWATVHLVAEYQTNSALR